MRPQSPIEYSILCNTAHPMIFKFLEVLQKLQGTAYVKIRGSNLSAPCKAERNKCVHSGAICKKKNVKNVYQYGPVVSALEKVLYVYS